MKKRSMLKASSAATLALAVCFQMIVVITSVVQAETVIEKTGYEGVAAAAREAVAQQMSTGLPSSASVAAMVGGEIVYAEGFGLRDRALNIPVDLDTQFGIGSVSKIFVAAGVLILVQEGRLELDKPVIDYLPGFVMQDERYKHITVRMLLNHTSGIPGTNNKDSSTVVKNRAFVQETLERLRTTHLINDPVRISVYCNDGFTVAEALVDRVSGLSYADFLEQNIFSKMGMFDTSAYLRDGNENVARVYEGESDIPLPMEYLNALASGGIASTAVDLCKYGEILQPGSILTPAMLEEYAKAQYGPETVPGGHPWFDAGPGWDQVRVYKFRPIDVDVLAKYGGTLQYCAELYVAPAQRISVGVIFAGYADPIAVADAVLEAALENLGLAESSSASPVLPPETEVPDHLRRIEGLYNSQLGLFQVKMTDDNKGIAVGIYDGTEFAPYGTFTYGGDGRFYRPDGVSYSFVEGEYGSVILVHFDGSDVGHVSLEKLESEAGIDASAFAGRTWIPRNLNCYDLWPWMAQTTTLPELPGYIIFFDGSYYTPMALNSPTSTKMSSHYLREQSEVSVREENGETRLYNYGYTFSDADQLPSIASGASLQIGPAGENEAGRLGFSGQVCVEFTTVTGNSTAVLPAQGRIVLIGRAGDVFTLRYE